MTQWVEYLTSDLPTSLVKECRKNGRAKSWKLPYFGVGNETWAAAGACVPAMLPI
jgi:alpha-N-arabinofuranosidase